MAEKRLHKGKILLEFDSHRGMWTTSFFEGDKTEPVERKTIEGFIGVRIPGVSSRVVARVQRKGKYTAFAILKRPSGRENG